jgi:hypothetical protein
MIFCSIRNFFNNFYLLQNLFLILFLIKVLQFANEKPNFCLDILARGLILSLEIILSKLNYSNFMIFDCILFCVT